METPGGTSPPAAGNRARHEGLAQREAAVVGGDQAVGVDLEPVCAEPFGETRQKAGARHSGAIGSNRLRICGSVGTWSRPNKLWALLRPLRRCMSR